MGAAISVDNPFWDWSSCEGALSIVVLGMSAKLCALVDPPLFCVWTVLPLEGSSKHSADLTIPLLYHIKWKKSMGVIFCLTKAKIREIMDSVDVPMRNYELGTNIRIYG